MRRVVNVLVVVIVVIILLSFPHPTLVMANMDHIARFDPFVGALGDRVVEGANAGLEALEKMLDGLSPETANLNEHFGSDGRLNVTCRLMYLFPLLDRFPKDNKVSFRELEMWNQRQALDQMHYDIKWHMKEHDKDGDGKLTLDELMKYHLEEEIDSASMTEKFLNADTDDNGSLNETELNGFLYPEDSKNPKVQSWLQDKKLREIDGDKDSKVSFSEFEARIHEMIEEHEDDDDGSQEKSDAKNIFSNLDVNEDKYLTSDDLNPLLTRLNPGELNHATEYTKYLIQQADDDGDGMLTLQEMLNHPHVFYSTIFEESPDDYIGDYDHHDEL